MADTRVEVIDDHPAWSDEAHALVAAFRKAYRRARRHTTSRLAARAHHLTVGDRAVVAAGGTLHPVVVDPDDVFDAGDWQDEVDTTIGPALAAVVAAAATRAAGVTIGVDDPTVTAAALRHLQEVAGWGADIQVRVSATIENGLRDGATVDMIAAAITESGFLSDVAAARVARTEAIGAANAGSVAGWSDTGGATKVWVAVQDQSTRETHADADGQEVPLGDEFDVGGWPAQYPGDPALPDEERINCRCFVFSSTGVEAEADDAEAGVDFTPDDGSSDGAVTASAATPDTPAASPSDSEMSRNGIMGVERSSPVPTITVPRPARFADAPPAQEPPPVDEADETPAAETAEDEASPVPGDQPSGAMIAVYPDDTTLLAVDGGEDPAELHVTVEYLGDAASLPDGAADVLTGIVRDIAAAYKPLTLSVSAVAEFGADSDSPALVLLMQGVDLVDIADDVEDALEAAGITTPDRFPVFMPHVTVAYNATPEQAAIAKGLIGTDVTFSQIGVAIAGEAHAFPLTGTDSDADPDDLDKEDAPVSDDAPATDAPDTTGLTLVGNDHFQVEDLADVAPPTADVIPARPEARWQGVLIVEGTPSGDKRFIDEGALSWRDLPLPLMWMDRNPEGGEGHAGASLVGRIDSVWRDGSNIMGAGIFDLASPAGYEAFRQVQSGMIRGVSADLDEVSVEFENDLPPDAGLDDIATFDPGLLKITVGRVMGATICPFPAFQEAYVALVDEPDNALAASGAFLSGAQARVWTSFDTPAVVASAGGPDLPPAAWFENPALDGPTPVRVTADGRIYGHVAQWGTCHIGMNRCVTPDEMRSAAGYRYFRTGQTLTADRTLVATGPIVVDTVHPHLRMQASDAQAFYADTGCAIADVTVHEDTHGIVIAGALRSDVSAHQVRKLRGGDVSPDWRRIAGRLEIVAMLTVNNSGYKVLGDAVAASAGEAPDARFGVRAEVDLTTGEVLAMVASAGIAETDVDTAPADVIADLAAQIAALATEVDVLRRAVRPFRVERARDAALAFKGKKAPPFGKPDPEADDAEKPDPKAKKAKK